MTLVSGSRRRLTMSFVLVCALLAGSATPARADITAFLGLTPTPERHALKGIGIGVGLLIVGFEFEFAHIGEDTTERLPGLKTYSGNVLVQTPTDGVQLYGTTGVEGYREILGSHQETHFGTNIGGGAKIRLVGPLRVRLDYRIFKLQGSPLHSVYQRFYVGGNLKF
jgi:opacity protein-like surface antigen